MMRAKIPLFVKLFFLTVEFHGPFSTLSSYWGRSDKHAFACCVGWTARRTDRRSQPQQALNASTTASNPTTTTLCAKVSEYQTMVMVMVMAMVTGDYKDGYSVEVNRLITTRGKDAAG